MELLKRVAVNVVGKVCPEADDLAQDLYIKSYDNQSYINTLSPQAYTNWLFVVGKNHHMNEKKSAKNRRSTLTDNITEACQHLNIDPFELLQICKKHLNEIDYLWIEVYLDHEGNYMEISRNFNFTRQQASTRLREIFDRLQKITR